MNRETDRLVRRLPVSQMRALEISGTRWKSTGFGFYHSLQHQEYDVCKQVTDQKFDIIIAEQVFEHLESPYRAALNVHHMLNDGGYFLITTPFLIKIHYGPIDCSRWSEIGLRHFLREAGFPIEDMVSGSWGNRECAVANFSEWVDFNPDRHTLHNDPEFPLVVWVLAKKKKA